MEQAIEKSNVQDHSIQTTETDLALSAADVQRQVNLIQEVMKQVMRRDEHYGIVPGTRKPTLLKAGAEKLCLTFRLGPDYDTVPMKEGEHLTVEAKCTLYHTPTGRKMGSGLGSCSTKESKYAWRKGQRICPDCSKEAIIKGKEEYGGGWVCWTSKGGCGGKWKDGDQAIEGQETDRIPNRDIPDQYNTVLKMACKRALIAAVLNVTAASDIFTQDLEPTEPEQPPASQAKNPDDNATEAAKAQFDGAKEVDSKEKKATSAQIKVLKATARNLNVPEDEITSFLQRKFGIGTVDDLPASMINLALKAVQQEFSK